MPILLVPGMHSCHSCADGQYLPQQVMINVDVLVALGRAFDDELQVVLHHRAPKQRRDVGDHLRDLCGAEPPTTELKHISLLTAS